jgi:glycosyltransferase involved in cell wall biosynthesis
MYANKKISFVIPAYNEASNVGKLYKELIYVMSALPYQFEFIFIDDGSTDQTLQIIRSLSEKDSRVFFLELSRNFGHQNALKAGLDIADGDCVISMDSDLQHPPAIVNDLIKCWEQGYDVVYTKRRADKNLPWLKRKTSNLFYIIYNKLSDLKLEEGTADFRLMGRNVLDAFSHLRENELFIRGLIKWSGFQQIAVEYKPDERFSGQSKYSIGQMISLAFKGITSFSVKPLKVVTYTGLILFLFSLVLVPYALISYFLGVATTGWTSIIITIFFFGSLQLLILGIIGVYLSKLVIQSKQRPLYFIRETNYKNSKK